MWRFIFGLALLLVLPSLASATGWKWESGGEACWETSADASAACVAAGGKWASGPDNCTNQSGSTYWMTKYVSCTACPVGQERDPVSGLCVDPPDPCEGGPDGAVYNSETESCACPEGQTDYLSTTGSYSCVQDIEDCSSSSSGFLGYVNNTPVCTYEDTCPAGTTGGVVNGDWMCVTEPDCDGGTWINGSCIYADETTPNPQGEITQKDTDGDGIPDSSDSDIDGDGIPNGSDDDVDGDGVLNVDDLSNDKPSSASGGNSCDAAPSCSGDAVDCAILQQQWLTRCAKEDGEFTDNGCEVDPQCEGDPLLCAGLIYSWKDDCALEKAEQDAEDYFQNNGFKTAEEYASEGGIFGDGVETDVGDIANGVFSSRSAVSGSCPAPIAFSVPNFGTFEYSLEPFCLLSDEIYWLVLLSAYLTAAFIIFRAVTSPV